MSYSYVSYLSLQRKIISMRSKGATTSKEVLNKAFGEVIARPSLAEHFNCGDVAKAGSVLGEPLEKRNIMGTKVQKTFQQCCEAVDSSISPQGFKTLLSDLLKRSSAMKGGSSWQAKKKGTSSSERPKETQDDNADQEGNGNADQEGNGDD